MKDMKKRILWMIALLCMVAQGIWAETYFTVSTEAALRQAVKTNGAYITLQNDIELSSYLDVVDILQVTIDLNGHTLSRNLSSHNSAGHVIWVHGGNCELKLTSTAADKGAIEGGMANNGGAIYISAQNKVNATNVIFRNNSAADHAGAIWNNGGFWARDCIFENNTANDVGAVYNAKTTEDSGFAYLINCTFTGNEGTNGAGALANAVGDTRMKIEGGTIQNNIAGTNGGGIWNGGTLEMQGTVTVTDNKRKDGLTSNVFLKRRKVITLAGALSGSRIGIDMETITGTFTSGYSKYHNLIDPTTFFSADLSLIASPGLDGNEACLMGNGSVYYIDRSWDATNKQVVSTMKILTAKQYTTVTSSTTTLGTGSSNPEFYVVSGEVNPGTIKVNGKDVHLILCNYAKLAINDGGVRLEGNNKLTIHSQSNGSAMGQLIVTNVYKENLNAAGIGSAANGNNEVRAGELVIHGGHIEVTGGRNGAGIGSCPRIKDTNNTAPLCNKVTVYGGYVKATGGYHSAGIGGGAGYSTRGVDGGEFTLYDGTVIATGKEYAAGLGGGGSITSSATHADYNGNGGSGGIVNIYGGELIATGDKYGAGIGSGNFGSPSKRPDRSGGTVRIEGGKVTATGGERAAGIGGGYQCSGGDVTITGGIVIASAGEQGDVQNRAIGPGRNNDDYGTLTIGNEMMVGAGNNGSVERTYGADERVNACWYRSYAKVSPCTHASGITYTINSDGTHTPHCKYCIVGETAPHFNSDGTGTCICGYKDGGVYFTITIATSSGFGYEGVGESVNVGNGKRYTLPVCATVPDGYEFAGWVVNPESHDNGIQPNEGETLLQAGENITVTDNVSIFARYQALAISLADGSDNGETLYTYNGRKAASVTLAGRTLYKDGKWNTLCLPFAVEDFTGTPLAGATVMELGNSDGCRTGFDAATGTLTLDFVEADEIEAGHAYIVKWKTAGDPIENPVFTGVTIVNESPADQAAVSQDGYVSFLGTYSPYDLEKDDKTHLFLGTDDKLYYPSAATTIGACRAYFQLDGIEAGDPVATVRAFVLHFGDETVSEVKEVMEVKEVKDNSWYDISGRRLQGKPSRAGAYIYNGKAVVIK